MPNNYDDLRAGDELHVTDVEVMDDGKWLREKGLFVKDTVIFNFSSQISDGGKEVLCETVAYCLDAAVDVIDNPIDEYDEGSLHNVQRRSVVVHIVFFLKWRRGEGLAPASRGGAKEIRKATSNALISLSRFAVASYLSGCVIPFDPLVRRGRLPNAPQPPLLTPSRILGAALEKTNTFSDAANRNHISGPGPCDYDLYLAKTLEHPSTASSSAATAQSVWGVAAALAPAPQRSTADDDIFSAVAATRPTRKGELMILPPAAPVKQSSKVAVRQTACLQESVDPLESLLSSVVATTLNQQSTKPRYIWSPPPSSTSLLHERVCCVNVAPLLHAMLLSYLGLPLVQPQEAVPLKSLKGCNTPIPPLQLEARLHTPESTGDNTPVYRKTLRLFHEGDEFYGDRVKELHNRSVTSKPCAFVASCNSLAYDVLQEWHDEVSTRPDEHPLILCTTKPSLRNKLHQRLLSYYTEYKLFRGLTHVHPHLNTYVDLEVECPCVEVTLRIGIESFLKIKSDENKTARLRKRKVVVVPTLEGGSWGMSAMNSSFSSVSTTTSALPEGNESSGTIMFRVEVTFKSKRCVRSCSDVVKVAGIVESLALACANDDCDFPLATSTARPAVYADGVISIHARFSIRDKAKVTEIEANFRENYKGTSLYSTINKKLIEPLQKFLRRNKSSDIPPSKLVDEIQRANPCNASPDSRTLRTFAQSINANMVLVKGEPVESVVGANDTMNATPFFAQLKSALRFLHFHHVFMGDVKRENCLTRPNCPFDKPQYEMTDFGSSVLLLPTTLSLHGAFFVTNEESHDEASNFMWVHRFSDYFLRGLVTRGTPSHRHPSLLLLAPLFQPSGVVQDSTAPFRKHIAECQTHLKRCDEDQSHGFNTRVATAFKEVKDLNPLVSLLVGVSGHVLLSAAAGLLPRNSSVDSIRELLRSLTNDVPSTLNKNGALVAMCSMCLALANFPREVDLWALGVATLDSCDASFSSRTFCEKTIGLVSSETLQHEISSRVQEHLVNMDEFRSCGSFNLVSDVPPTPMTTTFPSASFATSSFPPVTPTTVSSASSLGIQQAMFSLVSGGVDEYKNVASALYPTSKAGMPFHGLPSKSPSSASLYHHNESPTEEDSDEHCRRLTILETLIACLRASQDVSAKVTEESTTGNVLFVSPIAQRLSELKTKCPSQMELIGDVERHCFSPSKLYSIGKI